MCDHKGIRRLLISFNIVFLFLALALVGTGIWIVIDFSAVLKYVPQHLSDDKLLIQDVGIAAISIGAISAIISFLGCCGAAKESRKMLFSFLVMMIVIFLAVLVSGIVAISRQDLVRTVIHKTLEAEANSTSPTEDSLLKIGNKQYNCCGIDDMPLCDRDYPPTDKCMMGSPLCMKGCFNVLWDNVFSQYLHVAAIVLFVLAGIVLIGISFAIILFRALSNESSYSYVRQD